MRRSSRREEADDDQSVRRRQVSGAHRADRNQRAHRDFALAMVTSRDERKPRGRLAGVEGCRSLPSASLSPPSRYVGYSDEPLYALSTMLRPAPRSCGQRPTSVAGCTPLRRQGKRKGTRKRHCRHSTHEHTAPGAKVKSRARRARTLRSLSRVAAVAPERSAIVVRLLQNEQPLTGNRRQSIEGCACSVTGPGSLSKVRSEAPLSSLARRGDARVGLLKLECADAEEEARESAYPSTFLLAWATPECAQD